MRASPARARRWLAAMALVSLAAVAAAVLSQVAWDMQPCPWCVLQRLIFVAIAAVALLGMLWPRGGGAVVAVLALTGVTAALWQHFVAASSESCDLTLADRIMAATGLDASWPEVFMATASCAESKVDLFGLPYEFWSLGLFVLLFGAALQILRRR